MKKILFLTPIDIGHGSGGNQQDIRNRMPLFLSMGHQITIVQIINNINNLLSGEEKQNNITVYTMPKWSPRISVFNIAKRREQKMANRFIKTNIIDLIKQQNPDILWLEYNGAVELLSEIKKEFPEKKYYIRMHNYESGHLLEKIHIIIKSPKNIIHLLRIPFSFLVQRILENKTFKVADKIFSISRIDIDKYQRRYGADKLVYLPFFNEYQPKHQPKNKELINILYMGSNLEHSFNLYGLKKIINIAGKVKDEKINFYITGSNFKKNINLPKNIIYKGYVNDLENFLKNIDISLSPIDIGYGMKIKTYESLKRGLPSIIDKRSHKIFGGKENSDYLVADNNKEWVRKIMSLKDYEKRKAFSKNAAEFMDKNFSREEIIKTIQQEVGD